MNSKVVHPNYTRNDSTNLELDPKVSSSLDAAGEIFSTVIHHEEGGVVLLQMSHVRLTNVCWV